MFRLSKDVRDLFFEFKLTSRLYMWNKVIQTCFRFDWETPYPVRYLPPSSDLAMLYRSFLFDLRLLYLWRLVVTATQFYRFQFQLHLTVYRFLAHFVTILYI